MVLLLIINYPPSRLVIIYYRISVLSSFIFKKFSDPSSTYLYVITGKKAAPKRGGPLAPATSIGFGKKQLTVDILYGDVI